MASIHGPSYKIHAIEKLNEVELRQLQDGGRHRFSEKERSWHDKYKDSSYIYIGGLNYNLTEGDVIIVFSQWGEIVDINLIRDSKTGGSKGFCFLAYKDQRSTILAVDNANGMELIGRKIRVDHTSDYRAPIGFAVEEDAKATNETVKSPKRIPYQATGAEGKGIGIHNVVVPYRQQTTCSTNAPLTSDANSAQNSDTEKQDIKSPYLRKSFLPKKKSDLTFYHSSRHSRYRSTSPLAHHSQRQSRSPLPRHSRYQYSSHHRRQSPSPSSLQKRRNRR